MEEIAYQNKDITSKLMAETLKGKSLAAFGLPELKIVDILPTNLPVIESNELRLDNLFLLNDGSLAIIDYESSFSRENFVKYLNYIARVIRRFAVRRELKDLKQLKMVVIYTADVERAEERYDLGGLILIVESAYLIHLDGSQIYDRLKHKIDAGEKLAEEELMELMILPLTVKGKKRKQETIEKAVTLGKRLPDREGQLKVIAGILTFTDKVIDRAYAKKLEEEMQMTLVGQMLMDEGYQRGMEKGMEKGIQVFIQDNVSENVPEQRIIQKLQANFSLMEKDAINYYTRFSKQTPN
ncbi:MULTISPECIES: hypothetical protein [Hungatella]|uniref:Flagellar assembly protein H n=1 Tax=Hungatella hathewayi TaxID=154046 RepID=A0AAW9WLC9_9FIRM|nr:MULTISPECIES: hypothetical protein [Hungatella]MCQ4830631.1 hypothetical protein [Hungatella sp. SL.1.14]MUB65909.1 hypothetical protein [Hungatella hathewayi]CUQ39469.1 Uncharacterised protein [Hungatella hathewayi]